MKKLVMKYRAPSDGQGYPGTRTHEVQGEEVTTNEDGKFTYIRSYGPKPPNQTGPPKGRPVVEDFRVLTRHVVSVHESEVKA